MAGIRAFIACDIPDSVLDRVAGIQEGLRKTDTDVSWTNVRGIHITLKFLGDIDEGGIEGIASIMKDAAAGRQPFEIAVRGCGSFPNLKAPRVIWLGIEDPAGGLKSLNQALDDGLKSLGFEPEEREFRPHLTLGRIKGPKGREGISKAVSGLKDIEIGRLKIERMVLYKSVLRPTGAEYTKLKEARLGE